MTKNNAYQQQMTARLRDLGLPPKWVKNVLWPQWWSDELSDSASARYELESLLARQLGLKFDSLRDPSAALQLEESPYARFKLHCDTNLETVKLARALGARLGALAAQALNAHENAPSKADWSQWSAQSIRAAILESGASWVGLNELLDFCWNGGLPVVHATLPEGMKKFDGMALCPAGTPVILVFCNQAFPAWQAFIVAHELGHHVLGHIGKNGEIFDSYTGDQGEQDEEERAANRFAVELLTGEVETKFEYDGKWPKAQIFAQTVSDYGRQHHVLPGAILLNWFHQERKERAALCMSTLKIAEAEANALELYASYAQRANWLELSDDDYDFVTSLATLALTEASN